MNFGTVFKAFDTVVALRDAAKRLKGPDIPPPAVGTESGAGAGATRGGLTGHLEAKLTGVVVAALKEAFDRDHARLELERNHLEEERRRAEEERRRAEAAMRMERQRQAADRELGRLRLLGATAFVGWIASVALLIARFGTVSPASRGALAFGWVLLLGGLAAAFTAQATLGRYVADDEPLPAAGASATAALWLPIAGLAVSAFSLLV